MLTTQVNLGHAWLVDPSTLGLLWFTILKHLGSDIFVVVIIIINMIIIVVIFIVVVIIIIIIIQVNLGQTWLSDP
jgi:hypothetical protein